MDRFELRNDEEEEFERGINLPLINEDDDEVEEYGVDDFRCENGELLLALEDDEAINVS